MKWVLSITIILLFLQLVTADIYSDDSIYGEPKEETTTTTSITNYYNATNNTDEWDTNIGSLDDVNDTQMDNNGGTLTIDISWLTNFFNNLFSSKDTDDLSEGSTNLYDNQSWNESYANTLYSGGGGVNYSEFTIDIKSSKYNDIYWNITDADANDVVIQPDGEIKYVFGRFIE